MEERLYIISLYDLYGNLLTDREKEIYTLFYEDDLSLQEIADIRGVSKSSVGRAVKTIQKKLTNYEEKLGFYKKFQD